VRVGALDLARRGDQNATRTALSSRLFAQHAATSLLVFATEKLVEDVGECGFTPGALRVLGFFGGEARPGAAE
jgi:hypothetical protein